MGGADADDYDDDDDDIETFNDGLWILNVNNVHWTKVYYIC